MIKKATPLFMFSVVIIILFGCETAKGALKGGIEGTKKDWKSAEEIGRATAKNVGMALMKADQWMRKNLW